MTPATDWGHGGQTERFPVNHSVKYGEPVRVAFQRPTKYQKTSRLSPKIRRFVPEIPRDSRFRIWRCLRQGSECRRARCWLPCRDVRRRLPQCEIADRETRGFARAIQFAIFNLQLAHDPLAAAPFSPSCVC